MKGKILNILRALFISLALATMLWGIKIGQVKGVFIKAINI